MAAQQGIKRRIRSVSNTRQITKAMQLVAASKLRRAQESCLQAREFADAASRLLASLSFTPETAYHPLFKASNKQKTLVILVTSDRGLAGGYNANVIKAFASYAAANGGDYDAVCVGKYAGLHVARLSNVNERAAFGMDAVDIGVEIAQPLLRQVSELFLTGEVDNVQLIYTKFRSTVSQEVTVQQLLPITAPADAKASVRTLEPSAEELLDFASLRLLEAQIVQALLDALASEHASRMLAMKNATDNAGDLIEDLTLAFNNARQAAITQELAEISAGAEAIT